MNQLEMLPGRSASSYARSGTITVTAEGATGSPATATVAQERGQFGAPGITSFSINNGADSTASSTVTLNSICIGNPSDYMASESSDFTGASWQTYSTSPSFTLSSGNGSKTVYFKVKNALNIESTTVHDTIVLSEAGEGEGETIMLPGNVPLKMVRIPAGTFAMGSPNNEQSRGTDEVQHQVTLTRGFLLGKYEVTQAQWQAVMGTTPWSGQQCVLNDPNSPAVYVSWKNAQAFITQLNTFTGLTFRLPSEAEWEYACRAGTTTRFYWGDDPNYTAINDYAWWSGNALDVNERYSHVAGQKLPNPWGLYDMSGNAWEWCQDWYGSYANGAVVDPTGPSSGGHRIVRGGGWYNPNGGGVCRSAYRGGNSPDDTHYSIGGLGFRLAR